MTEDSSSEATIEQSAEASADEATDVTVEQVTKRRTSTRDLALVTGLPSALRQLGTWSRRPIRTIAPWLALSMAIGVGVLLLVWAVAAAVPPDPTRPTGVPLDRIGDESKAMAYILKKNALVLALHATACLAGFIIFAALRTSTENPDRLERVTRGTARVAIWWVPIATLLSIGTQAWFLGSYASTLSEHLHVSVPSLLLTTTPHALVELTAVFLPLAAWLLARRSKQVDTLYAATIASVLIAIPMLYGAAWVEVHQWRDRVLAAPLERPHLEGTTLATLVGPEEESPAARIEFGSRIAGTRTNSLNGAVERSVKESGGRSGAVAIVRLGAGYDLYELAVRKGDAGCGSRSFEPARSLSILDFAGYRVASKAYTLPGTVIDLDIMGVVDGDEMRSVEVDPALAKRCKSPFRRQVSPLDQFSA